MSGRTLAQWLEYQEQLHPDKIELGLDRVKQVWEKMRSSCGKISCPVIVVGGTNGKGSTVAYLEQFYLKCGRHTLAYTSPHLLDYNERIRLDGFNIDDAALMEAFEQVEGSRETTRLTYFEFGTLAALYIACTRSPDVLILEVGLGGRLDAVNILQHDVAVITSIAMDHMEWLGNDLSAIAIEKAGIARQDRPLIIGDRDMPESLYEHARAIGAHDLRIDRDYTVQPQAGGWDYRSGLKSYDDLPMPCLAGSHQLNNAAAAIMAAECLHDVLPVTEACIRQGLSDVVLPGRFEQVATDPAIYLDVAHNPAAAIELHGILQGFKGRGRLIAVFAMQSSRQVKPFIEPMINDYNQWYVAPLANGLGHNASLLESVLEEQAGGASIFSCTSVSSAVQAAREGAGKDDIIVVFGSFYTVAEARAFMHV